MRKFEGWFKGHFGRTSPEDVTDFAKVLALIVLGIDPTNGEPYPAWKLSARLQKRLREAGGWPYDFAVHEPNDTEEFLLDLWLVHHIFLVKRNRALKPEVRVAFINQVEDFVLEGSDLAPEELTELLRLYQVRIAEYSTAYQRSSQQDPPNFDFAEAVTRNLFGNETNSVKVALLIKITTDALGISLALYFTSSGLHLKIARGMTNLARL